jgi:hypothetical protein
MERRPTADERIARLEVRMESREATASSHADVLEEFGRRIATLEEQLGVGPGSQQLAKTFDPEMPASAGSGGCVATDPAAPPTASGIPR